MKNTVVAQMRKKNTAITGYLKKNKNYGVNIMHPYQLQVLVLICFGRFLWTPIMNSELNETLFAFM